MGQRLITQLVDDLDQTESDDVDTVVFGLDGVEYEIDLGSANAGRLRDALGEFVASARRTGGRKRPRQTSHTDVAQRIRDREENQKIRDWARENGWDVSERGRIPASVLEAHEASTKSTKVSGQRRKSRTGRSAVKS
jgi:hypothetical protein